MCIYRKKTVDSPGSSLVWGHLTQMDYGFKTKDYWKRLFFFGFDEPLDRLKSWPCPLYLLLGPHRTRFVISSRVFSSRLFTYVVIWVLLTPYSFSMFSVTFSRVPVLTFFRIVVSFILHNPYFMYTYSGMTILNNLFFMYVLSHD